MTDEKATHAQRMLDHCQSQLAEQKIRIMWDTSRLQWVANFIGRPEVSGYGLDSAQAIAMLRERSK